MEPVADDVNGHGGLEEEHVFGVEVAQSSTQTHGGHPVNELIQHCTQLAT